MTPGPSEKRAAEWARRYHARGLNPLPSRALDGRIRPWLSTYRDLRDDGIKPEVLRNWRCNCIQLALGARWGLVVVDLDGPDAREVWREMTLYRTTPATWEVEHDPEGGKHLWFSVPRDAEPYPTKVQLWELEGAKHVGIEFLGDRSLIVAPPSVSPKSGNQYDFREGHTPRDIDNPAPLPAWLDRMVRDAVKKPLPLPPAPKAPARAPRKWGLPTVDVAEVLDAVRGGLGLEVAQKLGVRVVGQPGAKGWAPARSIWREDSNPSAAVALDGSYWESTLPKPIHLTRLPMVLGLASSLYESINLVGSLAGVQPKRSA